MRSRSWIWTGLPTTVMVLGLFAPVPPAQADPIITYSTSGNVEDTGLSGDGAVISFQGITDNSFNTPSHFSLGDFQVTGLNPGQSETYTNTPFNITLVVSGVDGVTPSPNQTPVSFSGVLNGTVTGSDQSNVTATFNPISSTSGTFTTGSWTNTLSVTDNPLSLVPNQTNNGLTSAQALLTSVMASGSSSSSSTSSSGSTSSGGSSDVGSATTVPEPTTIALFLTTLAGLGVQRVRRARTA